MVKSQAKIHKLYQKDLMRHPNVTHLKYLYQDDLYKLPSLFYSSSIILLFSILESTLDRICNTILDHIKLPLNMMDLSGSNYIHKSKTFLVKFAELNFTKIDTEWIEITKYQKLRNLIVHQNSYLNENSDSYKKDLQLLRSFKTIELTSSLQFLIKDQTLTLKFHSVIKKYIYSILEELENKDFNKCNPLIEKPIFRATMPVESGDIFGSIDLPF